MVNINKAIKILRKCEDGLTIYGLSKELNIEYGSVYVVCKKFHEQRYITHKGTPVKRVYLTDKGREILNLLNDNPVLDSFLGLQQRGEKITKEVKKPVKKRKTKTKTKTNAKAKTIATEN